MVVSGGDEERSLSAPVASFRYRSAWWDKGRAKKKKKKPQQCRTACVACESQELEPFVWRRDVVMYKSSK